MYSVIVKVRAGKDEWVVGAVRQKQGNILYPKIKAVEQAGLHKVRVILDDAPLEEVQRLLAKHLKSIAGVRDVFIEGLTSLD